MQAFSDFSRRCEPSQKLDRESRGHIDQVLEMEREIMDRMHEQCDSLQKERRLLAGRSNAAKLFESDPENPSATHSLAFTAMDGK